MQAAPSIRPVVNVQADGRRVAEALIALVEEYTPREQVYFLLACRERLLRSGPLISAFARGSEPNSDS
jgi:hypothetical protein